MKDFHNKQAVAAVMEKINFDPWNLAGDRNRFNRQELLQLITGEKLPVFRSRVGRIEKELSERIDTTGATCQVNLKHIYREFFEE